MNETPHTDTPPAGLPPVAHLRCTLVEGVATVTIDRPAKRNAFTDGMYAGLTGWLHALGAHPDVRCIVLRGGERVFTAGSDIAYFLDRSATEREHHFRLVADLFVAPSRVPKPVIATVRGHALGGGTGLTAACDLAVATTDARFGLPEIQRGFWPCTLLPGLVRAIGARHAYDLALTGRTITAAEAQALGLVQRVVAPDAFDDTVAELAADIAAHSPAAVEMGKRTFGQFLDLPVEQATYFMGKVMALNAATEDAHEGITAFLEKRAPLWRGR